MSDKQTALKAIERMSEQATFRDIRQEIDFLAAIREGEEQADKGKVITLEQLEQNFRSWLSKSS